MCILFPFVLLVVVSRILLLEVEVPKRFLLTNWFISIECLLGSWSSFDLKVSGFDVIFGGSISDQIVSTMNNAVKQIMRYFKLR